MPFEWVNKQWYFQTVEYSVLKKKVSYLAMKSHRDTLNARYWVLEISLKRLFQLVDILKKAKLWRQWKEQWCQGLRGGRDEQAEQGKFLWQWKYFV